MTDIVNYFERTLALLASQFQIRNPDGTLTNFQKLVQALCLEAQAINTQQQLLLTMRSIDTSEGVQLGGTVLIDGVPTEVGIGSIVGLPRKSGQSDDDYREDLKFQIFINSSEATPEEEIKILEFLTDASKVWYIELYPAEFLMATNGLTFPVNPSDLTTTIQKTSPAGVNFGGITAIYDTNPFVFSGDPFAEQLFVSPNPNNPSLLDPFQVDPGSGAVDFYVNRGETEDPDFGGGFSEAILGANGSYTFDNVGAGQLAESIQ